MSAETPGVKFQFNFKRNTGTLVNYYDYTGDEGVIKLGLAICANVAPEIEAVETIYNAKEELKIALGARPVEQPRTQSASAEGVKTCKHGEMTFRTSKPGAAKTWKGYFCPSPKGTADQCEPQFIR